MTDLLQTDDGDWDIVEGSMVKVDGIDEVRQLHRQRLRTFRGEWFLDTTIGLPYFQEIFQKQPSPIATAAVIKAEILQTPGTYELLSFALDLDSSQRNLGVNYKARVEGGVIDHSEIISA